MSGAILDTAAAAQVLRCGGVMLLATDTVPGLHCRADRVESVRRIFACKGRPPEKSLLLLAGSLEQAWQMAGPLDRLQAEACRQCWPGPYSLILPAASGLVAEVTGGGATVAVRVPAVEALRDLIIAVGVPLVSTSANRTGEPPAAVLAEAVAGLGGDVDGAWGADPARSGAPMPSALVDLTVSPFRVLRAGPLPWPPGARAVS